MTVISSFQLFALRFSNFSRGYFHWLSYSIENIYSSYSLFSFLKLLKFSFDHYYRISDWWYAFFFYFREVYSRRENTEQIWHEAAWSKSWEVWETLSWKNTQVYDQKQTDSGLLCNFLCSVLGCFVIYLFHDFPVQISKYSIQVIDHVTGGHMRPMPGMDVLSFGAAVIILPSFLLWYILTYQVIFWFCLLFRLKLVLYLSNLGVSQKYVQLLRRIYYCKHMCY